LNSSFHIILIVSSFWLIGSCCKESLDFNTRNNFEEISERNQLPYTLPTVSNVATDAQTKEIFFYDKNNMDIVFRSIGVSDSSTANTKLWVQILNPDIKVFADAQIDSFYGDTVIVDNNPMIEIHNRESGMNFYEMDTALLALPFTSFTLDSWRPRLLDQTIATVHVKFNERFYSSSVRYDIERGVMKRQNQGYVGFQNTVSGDVFFVELEDRYILKSIVVKSNQ